MGGGDVKQARLPAATARARRTDLAGHHHQLPPAPVKELNQTAVTPQMGVFQRQRSKADEGHERDPTDELVAPPSAELELGRA
jgi:hypothetical protein